MPGAAAGKIIFFIVCHFVAPRASDASLIPRGIVASASSVATITTGTVKSAKVSDAQRIPPVPHVGVGSSSG